MNSINYLISLLPADDYKLLKLYFADKPEQEILDSVLSSFIIEDEPLERIFLLTKIYGKHPELHFPDTIIPRLKGVIRYFSVGNAGHLAGFNLVATELNAHNIPLMLMKGIALKFYRSAEPRYMWDVDILVRGNDYNKAIELAIRLGFEIDYIGVHSSDLKRGSANIDIHRLFAKGMQSKPEFTERIFTDATEQECFGARAYVPATEDLLLIAITNAYHNYFPWGFADEITHPYIGFIDVANIFEDFPALDWQRLLRNANTIGMQYQIEFFLAAFDLICPNRLPAALLEHLKTNVKKWDTETKRNLLIKDIKRKRLESFNKKSVFGLLRYFGKYAQYFYLLTVYALRLRRLTERHLDKEYL
ncbi:MAG: nucleotidyltransferase family protein [Paludibacter sp.]|jgi:hypothetical protein|nr:nucleotidyltransferase family protein [Paludibacter sp.]